MAREAIESLGVSKTLYMSGGRATFTLKEGTTLRKKQVAAALTKKNMKLESFGSEVRPRPEVCYVATVTGLG
ncbi:MAG: hypothetical protein AAF581_09145 [Planctomycetota bacterium]